jgi:hypothetical protein
VHRVRLRRRSSARGRQGGRTEDTGYQTAVTVPQKLISHSGANANRKVTRSSRRIGGRPTRCAARGAGDRIVPRRAKSAPAPDRVSSVSRASTQAADPNYNTVVNDHKNTGSVVTPSNGGANDNHVMSAPTNAFENGMTTNERAASSDLYKTPARSRITWVLQPTHRA